jgi:hypothetical protein
MLSAMIFRTAFSGTLGGDRVQTKRSNSGFGSHLETNMLGTAGILVTTGSAPFIKITPLQISAQSEDPGHFSSGEAAVAGWR